jgi:hypothetical protein
MMGYLCDSTVSARRSALVLQLQTSFAGVKSTSGPHNDVEFCMDARRLRHRTQVWLTLGVRSGSLR